MRDYKVQTAYVITCGDGIILLRYILSMIVSNVLSNIPQSHQQHTQPVLKNREIIVTRIAE